MNWRANRVLIIGGGICLALLITMSVLYFQFNGQSSQAGKSLDQALRELKTYKNKAPFPSQENINKITKNTEDLRAFKASYKNALSSSQLLPIMSDPNEFVVLLETVRKEISAASTTRSAAGEEVTTKLPEKFTFTFDDYLLQGKQPKEPAVPRLTVQLQLIQHILGLFFSNQVTELVSVKRDVFENEIEIESQNEIRHDEAKEGKRSDLQGAASHLFSTDTFEFSIKATEERFWDVVNDLSNSELPISIQRIEFKNGNTELQPKLTSIAKDSATKRNSRPAPVRRARRASSESVDKKVDAGTMFEKVVLAGQEDIHATFVLTLYKFSPEDTESTN